MICQVNRQKYRRLVSRLKPKQFIADADFQNDMLVFHSRADLHNLELYEYAGPIIELIIILCINILVQSVSVLAQTNMQ